MAPAPAAFGEQQQLLEGLHHQAHTQSPQGRWQATGPARSVPVHVCTILPMATLALHGLTASAQRNKPKVQSRKKNITPKFTRRRSHILLLNGPEILMEISL